MIAKLESNGVRIFTVGCAFQPKAHFIKQDVLICAVFDVRAKNSSIYWVPPAMRAFDNDIEVAGIDMHVVLIAVVTNDCSKCILLLRCNGVLGG